MARADALFAEVILAHPELALGIQVGAAAPYTESARNVSARTTFCCEDDLAVFLQRKYNYSEQCRAYNDASLCSNDDEDWSLGKTFEIGQVDGHQLDITSLTMRPCAPARA